MLEKFSAIINRYYTNKVKMGRGLTKNGVAETKYEFRCKDVPTECLYNSLDIIKNRFYTSNHQRQSFHVSDIA
jgi:hypothetical protein